MTTVIKNGYIYTGGEIVHGDLLIKNGVISAIGTGLKAENIIDAKNKLVSPGLVDVHVHYRDPGQTDKENVMTGSLAAAHGGFTTVYAMPNVVPVPNTPELMSKMVQNNCENGVVHILQYAPITVNEDTNEIPDYAALKKAGCVALSNDGKGVQNAGTMYLAMQRAQANNLIIAEHAQDDTLFNHGVINEGQKASEFNLAPITELAETTQIARDLLLAQKTGVHYHVCHVSTKKGVELIRIAKSKGINVTCEVAPHHLLLGEEDIINDNANFKMNPPLRTKVDQKALLAGLLDGTIDMIATDHAPHTASDKQNGFATAAFGIVGSETAFCELYTKFVKTGIFTLEQLLNWLTLAPSNAFGLKKAGKIALGQPADIAIFDLQKKEAINSANFKSKGNNTPFNNDAVYGQTVLTMVDGQIVFQSEESK
ncbi:dihydroorotase [Lactobacillus sp. M0396]|uniref:dihydroorotase n=1 Tax=Lactobacillus sp. M0396 TaxID=2751030 RepID=UPI0018DBC1FA|nr:dihydroorotase [Lactobacillus sp. M0396]MBI0032619.1 dihydroorotase [Lactobacillus sp. M0396]